MEEMESLEGKIKTRREVLEDEVIRDVNTLTRQFEKNRKKFSDEKLQEILASILEISLSVDEAVN